MEGIQLKDFIENTLTDIAQGVRQSNNAVKSQGLSSSGIFALEYTQSSGSKNPGIEFDVAITATKQHQNKAGFIVALANIGGGAKTKHTAENEKLYEKLKKKAEKDPELKELIDKFEKAKERKEKGKPPLIQ